MLRPVFETAENHACVRKVLLHAKGHDPWPDSLEKGMYMQIKLEGEGGMKERKKGEKNRRKGRGLERRDEEIDRGRKL